MNAVVQEYLMGEFTCTKLTCYHVNWELAHLHLARSCMCYISICLNHSQRSSCSSDAPPRIPGVYSDYGDHSQVMSQPLRDYVLDHALDHFTHLGPQIQSILYDIKVLEQDTQTHSRIWDNMSLSTNRVMRSTTPGWPTSRHDFILYVLVAYGPNLVLREYLRGTGFRPKEGTNPLAYAAYFNKYEHACTLLSRGANLNHRGWDPDGFCLVLPLELAFRKRHYDIVTLFVAKGSPVPLETFGMLYHRNDWARHPSSIVKILLQTDDFVEAAKGPLMEVFLRPSAILGCIRDNDINEQDLIFIVRRLIQVGYDPFGAPSSRDTLIRVVVQWGYVAVVQYLLRLGISFPSDLLVTLNLKHMRNLVPMVRYLVENGVNALAHDKHGDSMLHMSLATFEEAEALEIAKLLVTHSCDPFKVNFRGQTPLRIAVQQGHVSVVQYFHSLQLGTPLPSELLFASPVREGPQMTPYVVDSGASVFERTSDGIVQRGPVFTVHMRHFPTLKRDTPLPSDLLITSRMQNGPRMIRYLVDNGGISLGHASDRDSVLHNVLTAFNEYDALETARFLVAQDCNLRANFRGRTPFHIAVERKYVSVARYLLSLGAPIPSDLLNLSIWRGIRDGAHMIRFLVENGFDALARTKSEDSLLHITMDTSYEDEALETTELLVARGCDPLQPNSSGETPLCIAIKQGLVSVARYLLSRGTLLPSDLPAISSLRWSGNCARMIRLLIDNGAITLPHTRDGDYVLHLALATFDERDALETAKLLLDLGCDPLEVNSCGDTPLHISAQRGHVSVVHYLLSRGIPLPSDLFTKLNFWRMENGARIISELVENRANIHALTGNGDSVLHISLAIFRESEALEIAKLLVAHGCNPFQANSRGKTPLYIAVGRGHTSVSRYLLSLAAPVLPVLLVISNSRTMWDGGRMIRFLIENGFDVFSRTASGDTLLNIVIECFYEGSALETTKLLVAHGCDPFQPNYRGDTPICIAIRRGAIFLAHYLLSLGAPLPFNALFISLSSLRRQLREDLPSNSEMTHFLISQGADVLVRGSNGDSVLHAAIISFAHGDPEALDVITSLVAHGCDPAISNTHGVTPLHLAVKKGDSMLVRHLLSLNAPLPPDILFAATDNLILDSQVMDVIKVLITSGCDPLTRNEAGHTPLYAAVVKGYVAVADSLLAAMDSPPSEDLFSAAELAPPYLRDTMIAMLNGRRLAEVGESRRG